MYNLFLDDIRTQHMCEYMPNASFYRKTDWVIARDYPQFCEIITKKWHEEKEWPEVVSFDHDLGVSHYKDSFITEEQYEEHYVGLEEKTGMDCAKWLANFCMENGLMLPRCMVHSQNTVGAKNIQSFLESFIRHQTSEKL